MPEGVIHSLWRYPVKSLLGEKLDSLHIDQRGVVNDRLYAIATPEGKFASGKNTHRFRRLDGLFTMSATTDAETVSIKFPDGTVFTNDSTNIHEKLSKTLGQKVELSKENQISHFDAGSIHILTTGMLSKLQRLLPQAQIDERRFRPNIVVELFPDIPDDDLIGKTISLGEVELKINTKTERCRMITLQQGTLESRPELLKAVSKSFGLNVGVYASVLKPGVVRQDDGVRVF